MISEADYDEAFVWIWLPGEPVPVVAGRLVRVPGEPEQQFVFNYGRSYLARKDAIPIYEPELPLTPGTLPLKMKFDPDSANASVGGAWRPYSNAPRSGVGPANAKPALVPALTR